MEFKQIILILSILGSVLSTSTIIGTLSSSIPSNTYLIGTLAVGDRIYTNLTWYLPTTGTFTVVICWNKNSNNIYSTNHTISPVNLNYTTTMAGQYSVRILFTDTKPITYNLNLVANKMSKSLTQVPISNQPSKGIYPFNIAQTCNYATIQTSSSSDFSFFSFFLPSTVPSITNIDQGSISYKSSSNISTVFNETGTYYIVLEYFNSTNIYWIQKTLTFNFKCYDNICGNQKHEAGQSCDNGNITGCIDCTPDPLYNCGSNSSGLPCPCNSYSFAYNTTTLQCNLKCSDIQYSTGILNPVLPNQCYCRSKFLWDFQKQKCIIICSSIQNTNSSVPNTIDQCTCSYPYYFDIDNLACSLNCSNVVNSVGCNLKNSSQCLCKTSFIFNPVTLSCQINCEALANSIGAISGSIDQCICLNNYYFDLSKSECVVNCQTIPNSLGIDIPNHSCLCKQGFVWQSTNSICLQKSLSVIEIGLIVGLAVTSVLAIIFIVISILASKAKTALSVIHDSSTLVTNTEPTKSPQNLVINVEKL